MKRLCTLLVALNLATAFAAEEATFDYEFRAAMREGKVRTQELLRRLKEATSKPDGAATLEFADLFAAATAKANDAELKELGELLRALPKDALWFSQCFSAYATRKIRLHVAKLMEKPMRVEFQPTMENLPKELADAPAIFREAWKLHRSVTAPYQAAVASQERGDAPPKKTPPLEQDLRRLIGNLEPGAWKHLRDHEWGHWCGTGSEILYHPLNRALLLSFLADGKLHEAAGAALAQVPSIFSTGDRNSFDSVVTDLLTALGLDWEQVAIGSLLPITAYNSANQRPVVSSGFHGLDAWRMLSARGSAPSIHQCVELIRWAKLDPGSAGEFLEQALGPEPKEENVYSFSSDTRPVRDKALPQKTRVEVIALFAEYLAPKNSPADLIDAMSTIPAHCVRDLRAPLALLVSHPAHAVGATALRLLGESGLTTGKESLSPATPPLRFRLLLNGKPLSDTKISLNALRTRAAAVHPPAELDADVTLVSTDSETLYSRDLPPQQEPTTSRNGEIRFSLEECLEPQSIGSVQLRIGPSPFDSGLDDDFELPSFPSDKTPKRDERVWTGPWAVHQINVRAGSEDLHEISLRVADLEVKLRSFPEFAPGTPVKVRLRRVHSGKPFSPDAGAAKTTGGAGSSVFFRRLQSGKYKLSVQAASAAHYESSEITVGQHPVLHEVQLEPGRTARGIAVYPDGTKLRLPIAAQLFRDGTEIPRHDFNEWKGLAFGKYTARLPSTRESEAKATDAGLPKSRVPVEDRVGGREVTFAIDASTPAILDLGEIIVPREKR